MSPPTVTHVRWMDIFETGITELDDCHRSLVRDCNRLLDLVASKARWQLVVTETEKLVADCIAHFRVEESIMERTGFPRMEGHRAAHREIEEKFLGLAADARGLDGTLPAHGALVSSLGLELIELMIRHDLDYRSHFLYAQGQ